MPFGMGFFIARQEARPFVEVIVTAKDKLTTRQRMFAEAYLSNGANAYQAALDAGYAETTARGRSYELLKNERVQAYLDKRRKELAKQAVSPEQVLLELADIGFGKRKYPGYTMDGAEIQKSPGLANRLKALELMGKNLGMFQDKLELTPNTGQLASILEQLEDKKHG